MRNRFRVPFGILALVLGSYASAGAPAQWYDQVTLTYVYAGQSGDRVAIGISATVNNGTCPSYGELVLDPSNPHFKTMMALIMSAYMAEKVISVFTNGTCTPTGVLLTDVRLP